jgi:hypothetical protein
MTAVKRKRQPHHWSARNRVHSPLRNSASSDDATQRFELAITIRIRDEEPIHVATSIIQAVSRPSGVGKARIRSHLQRVIQVSLMLNGSPSMNRTRFRTTTGGTLLEPPSRSAIITYPTLNGNASCGVGMLDSNEPGRETEESA